MRVKDIMTPNVIGVPETATLWEALDALVRAKVSALVVFDKEGAPVGLLSEGDLLRRSELGTQKKRPVWLEYLIGGGRAARDYAQANGRRIGEIMTRGLVTIGEDAELSEGVDLMLARRIKRLIVTRDGRAVGVLSRSDLLKALMRALRGDISGLCQPTYILDIPGGHGKVPVGPGYLTEDDGPVVEDPWGGTRRYSEG